MDEKIEPGICSKCGNQYQMPAGYEPLASGCCWPCEVERLKLQVEALVGENERMMLERNGFAAKVDEERERCAMIAEEIGVETGATDPRAIQLRQVVTQRIAERIRGKDSPKCTECDSTDTVRPYCHSCFMV